MNFYFLILLVLTIHSSNAAPATKITPLSSRKASPVELFHFWNAYQNQDYDYFKELNAFNPEPLSKPMPKQVACTIYNTLTHATDTVCLASLCCRYNVIGPQLRGTIFIFRFMLVDGRYFKRGDEIFDIDWVFFMTFTEHLSSTKRTPAPANVKNTARDYIGKWLEIFQQKVRVGEEDQAQLVANKISILSQYIDDSQHPHSQNQYENTAVGVEARKHIAMIFVENIERNCLGRGRLSYEYTSV